MHIIAYFPPFLLCLICTIFYVFNFFYDALWNQCSNHGNLGVYLHTFCICDSCLFASFMSVDEWSIGGGGIFLMMLWLISYKGNWNYWHKYMIWSYLTTISVNVRDCFVRMNEYLLLLNRLRYGNMNGIMLSQIVLLMF